MLNFPHLIAQITKTIPNVLGMLEAMKSFIFPLVGICSIVGLGQSALAQKTWIGSGRGGDGSWVSGSFAPNGTPGTAEQIHFYLLGTTYDSSSSNVAVNSGSVFSTGAVRVGRGKEVNFTLSSGTAWTTVGVTVGDKNIASQTGSGASNVTFTAAPGAGMLKATQFVVGFDDVNPSVKGNSLTFTGANLKVGVNVANTATIVGRNNGESVLSVLDGADVILSALALGQGQNDNRTVVTGAGSKLTFSGITPTVPIPNPLALGIGSYSAAVGVNGGNKLYVADGGEVAITATNGNHGTTIGASVAQGGNILEIGNDGTFKTTGAVTVSSYNRTGTDRGANALVVRSGGAFEVTGATERSIDVSGDLIVEAGGRLSGNGAISILSGGVLRAAGNGLDLQGETIIRSGGALEVGTTSTAAEILTLENSITMQSGSELRLSLFGDSLYDQIDLEEGASLLLTGQVVLKLDLMGGYAPTVGTTFTLLTGETAGITGQFDTSHFDRSVWDFSAFNQAGGWRVTAIPEPSSAMLILGVGALLAAGGRWGLNGKK